MCQGLVTHQLFSLTSVQGIKDEECISYSTFLHLSILLSLCFITCNYRALRTKLLPFHTCSEGSCRGSSVWAGSGQQQQLHELPSVLSVTFNLSKFTSFSFQAAEDLAILSAKQDQAQCSVEAVSITIYSDGNFGGDVKTVRTDLSHIKINKEYLNQIIIL